MRAYLTEFIGTFFLVLAVGLSGNPLAIGASLMIMVYMGGHISGGHYNPAVSLAVTLRGKLSWGEFVVYVISQAFGAVMAAVVVLAVKHTTFAPMPAEIEGQTVTATALGALLVEFLYTFALALVVLNVATSPKTEGNSYYGLAIGFTIVVAAFSGGPISGGAFNPAVGFGPILVDTLRGGHSIGNLWIYLVGPLAGGAVAAAVYLYQNGAFLPAVDTSAPAGPREVIESSR
jgi:aquaporin Z